MKVVIIGGGYAGLACATRLARRVRAAQVPVDITLINPTDRFIERIRLHQLGARQFLKARSIRKLLNKTAVNLVTGSVDQVDSAEQTLVVDGKLFHWDRLVLALGSRCGRSDPEIHKYCLDHDGAQALSDRLIVLPKAAKVLVVGGGLTGIEAATEIKWTYPHYRVSILSRGRIADGWNGESRTYLLETLQEMDVTLIEGVEVKSIKARRLITTQGEHGFDACVWTAGFETPDLPRLSGLAVNAVGQALVDQELRSVSHPHIYAVGDIASIKRPRGEPLPLGCKSALPTGAHVGENLFCELVGKPLRVFDAVMPFYCVSLGRENGLVQWTDEHGRPLAKVYKGRFAAWFKEMVCKLTWWGLIMEARGRTGVVWKQTEPVDQSQEVVASGPST